MNKIVIMLLIGIINISLLTGQESEFQRYDIVRENSEINLESRLSTWAEELDGYNLYSMNIMLQGEYVFLTKHSITVKIPYGLAMYNHPESRIPLLYSFGDMNVSYQYLKQQEHINLFIGPQVTIPLTKNNEYANREGVYTIGEGRYGAGFSVSVTGIRDPVVWNAGFSYNVGLPNEERLYSSWNPGKFQMNGGFSDLLNEKFGFSLGLTQYVNLPQVNDGIWMIEYLSVMTAGYGEFFILFDKDYIRFTLEAVLFPLNKPNIFGITYGHQFKLRKES
jgi:hypothetical protein